MLVLVLRLLAASSPARSAETMPVVKVAAIQYHSRMADTSNNVRSLSRLVEEAASNGAKIIVLPECAVTGYMNPERDEVWSTNPAARLAIANWAETVPGPSTACFAAMASNKSVYLCVPLAEKHDGRFFNAQVLLNPRGQIIAHHRKKNLWPPGDGSWASEGELPAQVVGTEFGNIGLMICYDLHLLPPWLKDKHADIVLHSIGWFGPNTGEWFRNAFATRYVKPNHFAVVGANWTGLPGDAWPGRGFSFIADKNGNILNMADDRPEPQIVYAELPVSPK